MNSKKASYITLAILVLIGIGGFINITNRINNLAVKNNDSAIFPQILCVSIVILSIISIIETSRKEAKTIPLPNLKLVIAVIILTLIYLFVWSKFRIFYSSTIIYMVTLFWLCSKNLKDVKRVFKVGIFVAIGVTLSIFLFFEKAMQIRF